jgi:lipoate-protein ligase A
MQTQAEKQTEAFSLLVNYYRRRNNSTADHKKFVGAAMMYQKFVNINHVRLSEQLRRASA